MGTITINVLLYLYSKFHFGSHCYFSSFPPEFQARPEAGQRFKIPPLEKAVAEMLTEKTEIIEKLENKSSGLTK